MTETLIGDFEKTMAMGAALLNKLGSIENKLREDDFVIDMYGTDPGGALGAISTRPVPTAAQLPRQYNGPIVIQTILATWQATPAGSGEISAQGTTATPGAAALIASITPVVLGRYLVEWTVEVSGAAATTANNYNLVSPLGTVIERAVQPTAVGTYPQQNAIVNITSASQAISVATIAAEATGTITALITALLLAAPTSVTLQIADRVQQLLPSAGVYNPQGLEIQIARDDDITLTCTPAVPCSLEIMGYADLRKRDYIS